MALNEMTENVEVVQTLSTYPNQEDGLSAEELKAKFDQGPKAIKEYINDQLVPAVRGIQNALDAGEQYGLDTTLSVPGRAADAAAVGAALETKQNVATYHYEGKPVDDHVATWLDAILATMPEHSAVTVSGTFFTYSHVSYGILYKNNNDWASLYTTSYVDEEWRRCKRDGVWGPSEIVTRLIKALDNQAISEDTFTYGKGNFVGLMGYYYSKIDFEAKTITLSTKQLVADAEGIQLEWAIGDVVSIVNDRKYDRCAKITAISGNVITVDSLPFTELGEDQPDWDDYCIFVPDKPESGVVDLGKFATAIGEGNRSTARAATTIGRDNISQSMYGVCLGRGNTVKAYAGVTTGAFNTIEAEALYGSADGAQNTVTAPIAHAGGSNSKATKDGADADGYKCEADGEWSLARNYKTKATAPYAVALNEETECGGKGSLAGGKGTKTVEPYQTSLGKYNKPSTNYLFNIGCGTSDANRLNALAVHKDGNLNVFLHRIRNVGDAVDDVDAVNLRMLNARTNDYVVAQGTSGDWAYRKWNSGIAECWGLLTVIPIEATATARQDFYLPFTFLEAPEVLATSNAYSQVEVSATVAKSVIAIIVNAREGAIFNAGSNLNTAVHVIGRWK